MIHDTHYMDRELENLASGLAERLLEGGETIATAESCTGGWASMLFTSLAGSSAWFDRGFVTYTNLAKRQMLGVRRETLEAHGAVSEATVREMAEGALANSEATIALSISGIAGPGGGTPEKPVGTVCFGWMRRGGSPLSRTLHFDGDREAVRRQAVIAAIKGAGRLLGRD